MTTTPTSAIRDVPLEGWGKVMIEELLFVAAKDISTRRRGGESISVTVTVRLTPQADSNRIEISAPGAVEGEIRTYLPIAD